VFRLFALAVEGKGLPHCNSMLSFSFFGDVVPSFVWYYIIICLGLMLLPHLVLLYG
jgi:hypothetical protein